jgi:hypothetical protein
MQRRGKNPTTKNDTQDYDAGWPLIWQGILDLALVLWIVRVPVTSTALGLLVLGAAPQAQDLFVEFARSPDAAWSWLFFILRIVWFLAVLMLFWSMPTHHAARLLLDTDVRFQSRRGFLVVCYQASAERGRPAHKKSETAESAPRADLANSVASHRRPAA